MIFRRGKASYLYNDRQILGDRRGNRENAEPSSRMTPTTLGKFPVPEGTSGKVSRSYRSFGKSTESGRLELRRLEHCIPVLAIKFKLSEATSASASVASYSGRRLVTPFAMVRIVHWLILHPDRNYFLFLEGVGNDLLTIIR